MGTNKSIIIRCLAESLNCTASDLRLISENTPLVDLGMGSIQFIQFIVAIEEAFHIEVRDSDLLMERFETLHEVYQTLSNYLCSSVLKKVLVLDCDNVLWLGISGEEQISLTADVLAFQRLLLHLYEKGVLLCLCSRNEEHFIHESLSHTDMLLKKQHIVAQRINHRNKASNLQDLVNELNVSMDSFVFVDDSDYEIGLVKSLLPDITCVKAHSNDWINTIATLFSSNHSDEKNRTELYREQKEREKVKQKFATVEEYNQSLQTVATCTIATMEQIPRLSELSLRTNQFNLSNARYTEEELMNKLSDSEYKVFSLSVSDIYGDMGIVGMAILHHNIIESFMLSCRAFDRNLELVLLDEVKRNTTSPLYGIYRSTEKNVRYQDFYEKNGVSLFHD